jgi:hypothetical protein
MNYKSLIFHGLFSIIEYSEELLFSFIRILFQLSILLFGVGLYALYSKFIALTAIPGWTSDMATGLFLAFIVMISTVVIGLFVISIKKILLLRNDNFKEIK